jgi:xanthine dehydrogenase accessory factor
MPEFLAEIVRSLEAKQAVVLATVVGPPLLPPGVLGRKLLVGQDGQARGSLGAPLLDQQVAGVCRETIATPPHTRLLTLTLTREEGEKLGAEGATRLELFVEATLPPPTLLVVGGGHIAQPLSRLGKMLGFEVAVLDDRPSLLNRERFPDADQLIAGYYGQELARFPINPSTYAVLVTRGHRHDEESLRQIIASPAAYIGMIGSRRRVGAVLQHMAAEGVPASEIERVYSPIGLDIGAETPEEIAVSIMAEVVNVRRRGKRHPGSLSAKERHHA